MDGPVNSMDLNQHALGIGRIVVNLQSLEVVLRLFLAEASGGKINNMPQAGEKIVPLGYLTNRDSLGTLVDKYNSCLSGEEAGQFGVDREVVAVRDSLAHGRLMSPTSEPLVTLWKFGKPDGTDVPVERVETLTTQWLGEKTGLVLAQILNVANCGRRRGYASFPRD